LRRKAGDRTLADHPLAVAARVTGQIKRAGLVVTLMGFRCLAGEKLGSSVRIA
jgi:hypothetical protein